MNLGRALLSLAALYAPLLMTAQTAIQNIVVPSAASFQLGVPARGSIGTIFCTGLTVTGIVQARTLPLPFELAGVTVTVGGASAPLFAVAAGIGFQQVNFQVPQEAVFKNGDFDIPIGQVAYGTAEIVVQQNGIQGSALANISLTPGDFFQIPGTQYGIFQHVDWSPVTKDNPARPGEILVGYATGLPSASPLVPTGEPAPELPAALVPQINMSATIDTYSLVIGNGVSISNTADSISIPFLGLSPGYVGLYQVDFILPASTPPGDAQIKLERRYCQALFGACISFNTKILDSATVLLPVK